MAMTFATKTLLLFNSFCAALKLMPTPNLASAQALVYKILTEFVSWFLSGSFSDINKSWFFHNGQAPYGMTYQCCTCHRQHLPAKVYVHRIFKIGIWNYQNPKKLRIYSYFRQKRRLLQPKLQRSLTLRHSTVQWRGETKLSLHILPLTNLDKQQNMQEEWMIPWHSCPTRATPRGQNRGQP